MVQWFSYVFFSRVPMVSLAALLPAKANQAVTKFTFVKYLAARGNRGAVCWDLLVINRDLTDRKCD